jgi:glycosyltransferase involved in cell wall biosynthesis
MRKINFDKLKIAIVYDRVNKWGGAERVLLTLHEMFPNAPLYTSVYNPKTAGWAKVFPKIFTSFLQKIPFAKNHHELFGWLMPLAFERFNFKDYDLVISVTSEAAKGIITGTHTLHICYLLTPTRYLWSHYETYLQGSTLQGVTMPLVNYLRKWDKVAAQRPDQIIAISTEVRKRVDKYYNRDSEIIFPPVEIKNYKLANKIYFLYVGRLVGYKRVDLLVDVFNKLNLPLVIVGTGSQESSLKRKAKSNIVFAGFVDDQKLVDYYQNAKALIMPQEEDFGIVAVEAQSSGIPVIAYAKGGAIDTVVDGKSGVLFNTSSTASLVQAIAKFEKISFNHNYIRENAKRFSKDKFKRELQRSLIRTYSGWRRRNPSLAQVS